MGDRAVVARAAARAASDLNLGAKQADLGERPVRLGLGQGPGIANAHERDT